jgi:hypothetical protein
MKQMLFVFALCLSCLSARAIDLLVTQTNIPSTYPLWNSNALYPKISSKFNFSSNGVAVASGQMATNSVPRATLNATGIWLSPICLYWFDDFDLVITANAASNTFISNYFYLYPTHDLVTLDSNDVIILGPFTNIVGSSNLVVNTNISSAQGPASVAGYFLGCWNPGTNTSTNLFAQAVCKEKTVIVTGP